MSSRRRGTHTGRLRVAGLTFVEVALLIAVVGALLAIGVPTFVRHLRASKTAEAAEQLARLHDRAAAYFAASHPQEDGTMGRQCLPKAAGPVPEEPSPDPVEVDPTDPEAPGHATWKALDWQPDRRLRFRYTFAPEKSGCGIRAEDDEPVLTLRAEGDLDGDGTFSTYERLATVSDEGLLVPTDVLFVRDRME
ncbi:MAG: pilus assembly FimT family protein [Myxococcota bacterium]